MHKKDKQQPADLSDAAFQMSALLLDGRDVTGEVAELLHRRSEHHHFSRPGRSPLFPVIDHFQVAFPIAKVSNNFPASTVTKEFHNNRLVFLLKVAQRAALCRNQPLLILMLWSVDQLLQVLVHCTQPCTLTVKGGSCGNTNCNPSTLPYAPKFTLPT
jgi:hypothetical protein